MSSKRNVVIMQLSGDVPDQVRDFLHKKECRTQLVKRLEVMQASLSRVEDPVLLAFLGESAGEVEASVRNLQMARFLFEYPMIVVGVDVQRLRKVLSGSFRAFEAVDLPYRLEELLEALTKVSAAEIAPEVVLEDASDETPTVIVELDRSLLSPPSATLSEFLFTEFENLQLYGKPLGGKEFRASASDEFPKVHGVLPKNKGLHPVIKEVYRNAGVYGRSHLARVAFVADRILKALNTREDLLDLSIGAAYLWALDISGKNNDLFSLEYSRAEANEARAVQCSRLKDSAMRVAIDHQLPQTGNIIAAMARLIGGEDQHVSEEIAIAASVLMAADMIGKTCWKGKTWNSRGAYFLMKRFRAGVYHRLHPAVLCCAAATLSEAIACKTSAVLLPPEVRNDPELIHAARVARDREVHPNEKKVRLEELTPGMRLSQPLVAFDGRLILSADLRLDQDLIWRIWQLSAMRPLNAPMVVEDAEAKESLSS